MQFRLTYKFSNVVPRASAQNGQVIVCQTFCPHTHNQVIKNYKLVLGESVCEL